MYVEADLYVYVTYDNAFTVHPLVTHYATRLYYVCILCYDSFQWMDCACWYENQCNSDL